MFLFLIKSLLNEWFIWTFQSKSESKSESKSRPVFSAVCSPRCWSCSQSDLIWFQKFWSLPQMFEDRELRKSRGVNRSSSRLDRGSIRGYWSCAARCCEAQTDTRRSTRGDLCPSPSPRSGLFLNFSFRAELETV